MNNEYTCAVCKGVFTESWTEEEAMAEMHNNFGEDFNRDDCEVICDDCYKEFMGWHEQVKE
jgi:hypothetical protein